MPKWDVIVVGGGIWGLSCAHACARRGQSVAVFDSGAIGQGASGGVMGAMSPHAPEGWNAMKQFQFDALLSAETFWAGIDAVSGLRSGYGRIGRVMPITSVRGRVLAEERAVNVGTLWQDKYRWSVLENHPLISDDNAPFGVTYDTLSARMYPAHAVASLAGACRLSGVKIFENRPVTRLESGIVQGDWGEAFARAIILAGGREGFTLLDTHMDRVTGTGVKGQAALLACDLGDAPQLYANGVYVIPHEGGVTAVGSTAEKTWGAPDCVDEKLEEVIAKARMIFPALGQAPVLKRWAGLRPKARRRYPMLGPVPGLNGIFSAMGAYTIGFGIAHKVGEVLAAFAAGGTYDLPKNFTVNWHME
ncbi:MAG: FAD-binding oxidoreductase [Rhodobacterales bacterium]